MRKILEAPKAIARLEAEIAALRAALANARDEGEATARSYAAEVQALHDQLERQGHDTRTRSDALDARMRESRERTDEVESLLRQEGERLRIMAERIDSDQASLRTAIDALRHDLARQGDDATSLAAVMFDRIDAVRHGRVEPS
jgi:chromosome segregation ATPase